MHKGTSGGPLLVQHRAVDRTITTPCGAGANTLRALADFSTAEFCASLHRAAGLVTAQDSQLPRHLCHCSHPFIYALAVILDIYAIIIILSFMPLQSSIPLDEGENLLSSMIEMGDSMV